MKNASLPNKKNCDPAARIQEYEYDIAGKSVKWDYPSGKAVEGEGHLALSGLGLQDTGSEKDTYFMSISDICDMIEKNGILEIFQLKGIADEAIYDNVPNLFNRFLNPFATVDWHPARSWTIALLAKAIEAVKENPTSIEKSIEDTEFAYQRVAGVNPGMLKQVVNPEDIETLNNLCGSENLNKKYYVNDYQVLKKLQDNDPKKLDKSNKTRKRFVYYPEAFFEVKGKELKPVAIRLRRKNNSKLVKPSDDTWTVAKFIVQNADINYHELIAHLGGTHLYVEAFAVATGRCLPKNKHPLSVLLRPHFEGTVNINDFATTDLINIAPDKDFDKGGVFDLYFAGTMESNIALIAQEVFGIYDDEALSKNPELARKVGKLFKERMLPNDIANRGVGTFKTENRNGVSVLHTNPEQNLGFDYPYLEDSCKLWNAITDWVCDYIQIYYKNDADVAGDCELQAWVQTVVEDGKIKGFAEFSDTTGHTIKSRSYLIQAVTSIIFTASVQHAAVNFPQAKYGPTLPAGIYHDFFEDKTTDIKQYLPHDTEFSAVMQTLSVLSSLHYTKLGVYHPNITLTSEFLDDATQVAVSKVLGDDWIARGVGFLAGKAVDTIVDDGNLLYFKDMEVKSHVKKFREALAKIEKDIKEKRGITDDDLQLPINHDKYIYLVPSLIPQSINI